MCLVITLLKLSYLFNTCCRTWSGLQEPDVCVIMHDDVLFVCRWKAIIPAFLSVVVHLTHVCLPLTLMTSYSMFSNTYHKILMNIVAPSIVNSFIYATLPINHFCLNRRTTLWTKTCLKWICSVTKKCYNSNSLMSSKPSQWMHFSWTRVLTSTSPVISYSQMFSSACDINTRMVTSTLILTICH